MPINKIGNYRMAFWERIYQIKCFNYNNLTLKVGFLMRC